MSDDFQQRGGSPWGTPPGGGSSGNGSGRGPRPPDGDKIIKEFQEKIKKFLNDKGYSDDLIFKAGLLRKNSNNETQEVFKGRLIFPIFDISLARNIANSLPTLIALPVINIVFVINIFLNL